MASLLASQHYNNDSLAHRKIPTRPQLPRQSPWSVLGQSDGFHANAPALQRIDVGGESSDDEVPQPMKFSALTKALLENDGSAAGKSSPVKESPVRQMRAASQPRSADTPSRAPSLRISRRPSPNLLNTSQNSERTSPRVVRVGSAQASGSSRRATSVSGTSTQQTSISRENKLHELVTPAPAPRAIRVGRSRAGSNTSNATSTSRPGSSAGQATGPSGDNARNASASLDRNDTGKEDALNKYTGSAIGRSRQPSAEAGGPPGSMKFKRPMAGSFLRGAPIRRGFRRRDSDENHSPNDEYINLATGGAEDMPHEDPPRARSKERSLSPGINHPPVSVHDFARPPSKADNQRPSGEDSAKPIAAVSEQSRPSTSERAYALPPPRSAISGDKENEPPPTFKRNKDQEFKILGRSEKVAVLSDAEKPRQVADTPVPNRPSSPRRDALAPLSKNTPHRYVPPPPPKMTVLETATAQAGASAVKSKKKRSHVLVNGKAFTLMGKIGKGGSSDVYRVMAENQRMFALKKVKLEDCDEMAVRGYKGEIELLQRLSNVDRVVRLLDWELDEEKQSLSVLMEMGEVDLNRLINSRLNSASTSSSRSDADRPSDNGTPGLDLAFTRFYWREMLCCLDAVHAHDIVHSDLKPANFLLVQGHLKLIDFGIANRIETDITMNVHRESHVGTPNYMSPESIIDTNASVPVQKGMPTGTGAAGKMMKIGKPSDVWSLGCILYQMTYGRPPFAHIPNQVHRIMAITNPNVEISFPERGVGGSWVPHALRSTLRKCLNRDQTKRPTVADLLSERDPFLYPEGYTTTDNKFGQRHDYEAIPISQELLGQVIARVVDRCRDTKRGFPSEEEVRQYPSSFFAKIAEMMERG